MLALAGGVLAVLYAVRKARSPAAPPPPPPPPVVPPEAQHGLPTRMKQLRCDADATTVESTRSLVTARSRCPPCSWPLSLPLPYAPRSAPAASAKRPGLRAAIPRLKTRGSGRAYAAASSAEPTGRVLRGASHGPRETGRPLRARPRDGTAHLRTLGVWIFASPHSTPAGRALAVPV
jgi:hypothetical protein